MPVIGIVGIIIFVLIYLGIITFMIISWWKLFEKAGQPGWAAIVPIYNIVIMLTIIKKPMWWIALMFVPIANVVVMILIFIELAKVFGKDSGFAVGLIFLSVIFIPILAFGDAVYEDAERSSNADILDL